MSLDKILDEIKKFFTQKVLVGRGIQLEPRQPLSITQIKENEKNLKKLEQILKEET